MKKNYRFIQFTTLLILIILFACQKEKTTTVSELEQRINQNRQDNFNSFLLDKIKQNKIVMLGDHEHGHGLYSRIVIDFLKYWLDQIEHEENKSIPFRMALFLEHDSLTNQRLYRFFQSGNLMDFIEPEDFAVDFTIDKIEFFHDLRDIRWRIQERNHTAPSDNKIHFEIIGPERIPSTVEESQNEPEIFSIEQRDKFSAEQVHRYLEIHPGCRAFIFYGAAHLFRRSWPKSTPPYYTYTLAYHLTEKYTNHGGCYTIFQYNLGAESGLPPVFDKPSHSYALENQYLTGLKFDLPRFPYDADASFFLDDFSKPAVHINQVPTNNFFNLFLDCLEIYLKNPDNPGNKLLINAAVQYLQMLSGFPVSKIEFDDEEVIYNLLIDWKMWYLQNGFDPIFWTRGYQFLLEPFRLYRQNPNQENRLQIEQVLKKLSGSVPDTTRDDPAEQVRIWLRHLEQNKIPIMAPRLIQICWVGNADEQRQAIIELKKLTGESFNTAKEWTKWWRKKVALINRMMN